jgi:hypothetical protein
LLLAGAALPASAFAQCVTDTPAVDACRGGVRIARPAGATLDLSFMTPGTLDPRITFTRASSATYTDASGVIQTAAVNAPRWDYTGGVLRGLLIEEARTNIWLQSADASNAAWTKYGNGGPAAPVVIGNQQTSPDGTITAASVAFNACPTSPAASSVRQTLAVTAAQYTFSVYLKGVVGGEQLYLCATPDGISYARQRFTLTNTWVRYVLTTGTLTAGTQVFEIGADLRDTSQTATLALSAYVWGAQVEQGAFPTSYIPTTSVSVTRAADVASMPTNVSWFSAGPSSLAAEFMMTNAITVTPIGCDICVLNDGTTNNRLALRALPANGASPLFYSTVASASTLSTALGTISSGAVAKIAGMWNGTAPRGVLNGGAPVGYSSVLPTGITTLVLGNSAVGGSSTLNGYIRRVTYWNRALSDTEMQQVTA